MRISGSGEVPKTSTASLGESDLTHHCAGVILSLTLLFLRYLANSLGNNSDANGILVNGVLSPTVTLSFLKSVK